MRLILWRNAIWMGWNLTLALVPLGLSFWLFRNPTTRRSLLWWLGLVAFVAFLPNAPYVLTDIIHLTDDVSAAVWAGSETALSAILLQYTLLFAIGFGAYAWALWNLAHYLLRVPRWPVAAVAATLLAVHALCAVGVMLGRFGRFNSWHLATEPSSVARYVRDALDNPVSWKLAAFTFVVFAVGTALVHAMAWGMMSAGRTLLRLERA